MRDKYARIVRVVLDEFDIKYSKINLENDFLTNPNTNNFYGLSQVLEKFGLRTLAVRTDFDEALTHQKPFLAQFVNPTEIYAVSKVNDNYVEGVDEKGNNFKHETAFLEGRWAGNALYVSEGDNKKTDYSTLNHIIESFKSSQELLLLLILVLFFINRQFIEGYSFFSIALFCVNLLGLIVSYQILKLKDPEFKSKICEIINNGNCKSIINSTKFLNVFDYDKIGIVYFLFLCAIPIVSSYQTSNSFLLIISLMVGVFPFYSVYYQKFIEKKWCVLCLIIQACLIINLIVLISGFNKWNFSIDESVNLLLIFSFILITASYIFSSILSRNDYIQTRHRLNRFIRNEDLFSFLLDRQVKFMNIDPSLSISINIERENELTLVTNPFCRYCKESYKMAKELILSNENFGLNMIYLDGDNSIGRDICKQFISIYFLKGNEAYLTAVDEWYDWGYKDYPSWQNSFRVRIYPNVDNILKANESWAKIAKISATPTILINGRIIPNEYELNDLKYF